MEKTHSGLSAWQLTMMALGTVVGGSFFLGSAIAIKAAGPAVVISYIFGGILVYFILAALSEMTVADAASGSFRTFAERMYGTGTGFVVGWVYWTGLVLAISSEATAAGLLLRIWFPGISIAMAGTVIIIAVTLANLLGAKTLSKLESGLALVKLIAIAGFIVLAITLIFGLFQGAPRVGAGNLANESWFPAGISGIAGSMLIVMFTYAGFEIIGLAASESANLHKTVPKAIIYTVAGLAGLYITAITVLLPLIPTAALTEEVSPMVVALTTRGLGWAGNVINIVLVTAIISTMLAAMFGLGRMIRSLADEGQAPGWLDDRGDVPYRGILFSGGAMLTGMSLGFLLPEQVYLFLISSGGFSLLFAYVIILVTHYKFRKINGCPAKGQCQLPWYPFSSVFAIISLVAILASMPLIPGQASGLVAGLGLVALYTAVYVVFIKRTALDNVARGCLPGTEVEAIPLKSRPQYGTEFSAELSSQEDNDQDEEEEGKRDGK